MKPVVVLTGPTGGGKSALLYSLSKEYPLEIINLDSRQIYRQMKIGTALPEETELQRWPHHLFSFIDPDEKFSAGTYLRLVQKIIPEIHSRNRIPVFAGGTYFYLNALWDGLLEEPSIPDTLIARINELPDDEIRTQLKKYDPVSAERIPSANVVRLRRALLVTLAGDKPFSAYERTGGIYSLYNFHAFSLEPERSLLYTRINERVEKMFAAGLPEELDNLLKAGYTLASPGLNSIGYREILEYMEKNFITNPLEISQTGREEIIQTIAQNTRHYAKRQFTWSKSETRLKRIDPAQSFRYLSSTIEKCLAEISDR